MYNSIITYIGLHCSAHWKMVIILPKENVVIWFCSLHNRPDNYLKGIINRSVLFFNTFALALVGNIDISIVQYASMFVLKSTLKGFNDTPQSKSKVAARWIVVKVSHLHIVYEWIWLENVLIPQNHFQDLTSPWSFCTIIWILLYFLINFMYRYFLMLMHVFVTIMQY